MGTEASNRLLGLEARLTMSYTIQDAIEQLQGYANEFGPGAQLRVVLNQFMPMGYEVAGMGVVSANAPDTDDDCEEEFLAAQRRVNELKAKFDRTTAEENELNELMDMLYGDGSDADAAEMVVYIKTGSQTGYTNGTVNRVLGLGGRDA